MRRPAQLFCLALCSGLLAPRTGFGQTGATGSAGSGFAVSRAGFLVTNHHVIDGCREVSVTGPAGRELTGVVTATDPRNDLALVSLGQSVAQVAVFRRQPLRAGEDVIALGFPMPGVLADALNVSKGIVSATAGLLNDSSKVQISAAVHPGNSGGPLVDASGHLAGVVVSKLDAIAVAASTGDIPENIAFAIKGEIVQLFMRATQVEPTLAPPTAPPASVADVVDLGRAFAYSIECYPPARRRATGADGGRERAARPAAPEGVFSGDAKIAYRVVQMERDDKGAATVIEVENRESLPVEGFQAQVSYGDLKVDGFATAGDATYPGLLSPGRRERLRLTHGYNAMMSMRPDFTFGQMYGKVIPIDLDPATAECKSQAELVNRQAGSTLAQRIRNAHPGMYSTLLTDSQLEEAFLRKYPCVLR